MTLNGCLGYLGSMAVGRQWQRHLREIRGARPGELEASYEEALLQHAARRVPYYAGLEIETPRLNAFPVLTRRTLRERSSDLRSLGLRPHACSTSYTGGSTGEPVWVLHDRAFQDWFHATDMFYIAGVVGISLRDYLSHPRVVVWHRRPSDRRAVSAQRSIARRLGQVIFQETNAGMGDDALLSYLHEINGSRPLVILGTSSYLFELARLAKRQNLRVHRPRAIFASAEMLYPRMRDLLQEVFGCRVYERYGAVEAGRVAGECRCGSLHVFSFACRVEVLDESNHPAPLGHEGRILVTPLHNLAMPLIRYDIGDLALRRTDECACGSPLPVLGKIRGRVVEHFVAPDGRLIFAGTFVAMFADHPWIEGFQLLQEDVDRVTVFYRPMPGVLAAPGAVEELTGVIRGAMGTDCRVRWEEVDELPRTPLGKHLQVRSLVWQEREKSLR